MGKKGKRIEKREEPGPANLELRALNRIATFSRKESLIRLMDTAIWLWFSDKDLLSIHMLVMACYRALKTIGESSGKGPRIEELIGAEPQQFTAGYDFLRHSSPDPEETIDFPLGYNAFLLFACANSFGRIFSELTVFMVVFRAYFALSHRTDTQTPDDTRQFFPNRVTPWDFVGLSPREFWHRLVPTVTEKAAPPLG